MLFSIQLYKSKKFLVLKPDGTLTIEANTTLFNSQGDLLGAFSYDLELPLEDNRVNLDNSHYIHTETTLRTVDIILWIQSRPYKTCKMSFTYKAKVVEANCYIDSALINSELSNLTLPQLIPEGMGSEVFLDDNDAMQAYMKSTCTASPGTMPMVFFPWLNQNAYKNVDDTVLYFVPGAGYDASTNTPNLHDDAGGVQPPTAVKGWVFKVAVGGTPDHGSGSVNVLAGQYMKYDGAFWYASDNPYGIRNELYPGLIFPIEKVINRWEMDALGNGSFKLDPPGGEVNQTQTPFFFLVFILKRIAEFFGCKPEGNVLKEDYFNRIVIWSRVGIERIWRINDCSYFMPAITVTDFLSEIRLNFGILTDFDLTNNICYFESLINLETTPKIVNLKPNQEAGTYEELTKTTTYYVIRQAADSADSAFGAGYSFPAMQIGDSTRAVSKTDITLNSVATKMITNGAAYDALLTAPILTTWKIPQIDQPMYSPAPYVQVNNVAFADKNNFKLRFLYWHGMQPDNAGFTYPYGSSDNVGVAGNRLTNFTLSMTPAAADYSALRYYYNFMINTKPFQMGFLLPVFKLFKINAVTRILVKDPYNFVTVSCILTQSSPELTPTDELIPTMLQMNPVILPKNTTQILPPVVIPPPGPPVDNGLVYARLVIADEYTEIITEHPTPAHSFFRDLTILFYSDLAGTVPKDVTGLPVGLSTALTSHIGGVDSIDATFVVTDYTGDHVLKPAQPVSENYTDGSGTSFNWVYTLLSSAYYTIIA